MSTMLILNNIIAYVLQIGLLVGIGVALPMLLRLKAPRARLLYWQLLLVACLALPWMRPWHREVIAMDTFQVAATETLTPLPASAPMRSAISFTEIALWLLAAGVIVRLGWLAFGLLKLSRYRRQGRITPLPPEWMGAARHATLLVSDRVGGPVTFGFFRPVVLLPASFPAMPDAMREAILFHELLHVERRDWLFTMGEELVRTVFWFHPAIWWVLGEIQLAREQTVDQAVIEMTQGRDSYVDTLLAMAGLSVDGRTPQLDLAPAPLFLRRRHLKQRVLGVMQGVSMSKTRLMIVQVVATTVMAVACWFVSGAVPMSAAPQVVADSAGVSVNLNGAELIHRSPVNYPADALAKGVAGTVVVQVRLDANGEVIDDQVLSGPDELRRAAQQSVLTWHFDKSVALTTRLVNIDFVKPADAAATSPATASTAVTVVGSAAAQGGRLPDRAIVTAPGQSVTIAMSAEKLAQVQEDARQTTLQNLQQTMQAVQQAPTVGPAQPAGNTVQAQEIEAQLSNVKGKIVLLQRDIEQAPAVDNLEAKQRLQVLQQQYNQLLRQLVSSRVQQEANLAQPQEPAVGPHRIESILVTGLSDAARDQLLAQLPVHVGDSWSGDAAAKTAEAIKAFDSHLSATTTFLPNGRADLRIAVQQAALAPASPTFSSVPPSTIRVGGAVMASNLISQVRPVYPAPAKNARVQGAVRFEATIGKEGTIQDLKVVSGPPMLVQAAMEAVRQWVYRPVLLNGAAVAVATIIDVNFTLADTPSTTPPQ